jgi:hypothetical protein
MYILLLGTIIMRLGWRNYNGETIAALVVKQSVGRGAVRMG